MQQHPATTNGINGNLRRSLRAASCAAAYLVTFLCVAWANAYGQTSSSSAQAQDTVQFAAGEYSSTSSDTSGDAESSGQRSAFQSGSSAQAPQATLSSDQIIEILQGNPDLLMELKSQLADRMQQQGVQIDPNDISDQTLFRQISSNASLRANITTVLRARGLVSDDDLQSLGSRASTDDLGTPSSMSQNSFSVGDNTDGVGVGSGSRTEEGMPGVDVNGAAGTFPQSVPSGQTRQGPKAGPRKQETASASTDLPAVIQQPAPFDFQSMRDLYAQVRMRRLA